jgi:asparagine synthase (glutamine-hydrolysing)
MAGIAGITGISGIAGILSKDKKFVKDLLGRMLSSIVYRGDENKIAVDPSGLIGFGCCYRTGLGIRDSEFGFDDGGWFVAEGEIADFKEQLEESKELSEGIRRIIFNSSTGFSMFGFDGDKLILARDVIGLKPLYFVNNENIFAFCSEKKGLWEIGLIDNVEPIKPGEILLIDNNVIKREDHRENLDSKINTETFESNMEKLEKKLKKAVLLKVIDDKAALLFSGGLDSSVIAQILVNNNVEPQLYCTGFRGSRDFENARDAAKKLGLKLNLIELTDDLVRANLETIVYHLESTDTVTAEIAAPFYFAAKLANKHGFSSLFTGQGADELFGGYSRYEKIVHESGHKALQTAINQDIQNIWSKNLERDVKICMAHGIELNVPYLDRDLVEFGLTIPPENKVKKIGPDFIRKHILRKLGKQLGLPTELTDQPKTAVQYGSGSSKCFRRLARELLDKLGLDIEGVRALGFNSGNELLMNYVGFKGGLTDAEIKNAGVIRRLQE